MKIGNIFAHFQGLKIEAISHVPVADYVIMSDQLKLISWHTKFTFIMSPTNYYLSYIIAKFAFRLTNKKPRL